MNKKIIQFVLIGIIIIVLGLYIYDLSANQTPPSKYLFRTVSIVLLCAAGLVRSFSAQGRLSLNYYESQYPDILQYAFADQPLWKKKLLCAVRLYNENNCDKSLKYLIDLKDRTKSSEDAYAVYLFAALCYTDLNLYEQAEAVYQQMVNAEIANSRVFSNLGNVQMKLGKHNKALANYKIALDYDRDNAFAYNNISQAHFQLHEFEEAIEYAKKALEINPKIHQASVLLAVVYTLLEDDKNAEKYFHIAISSGRDPQEVKDAIAFYRTAKQTTNVVEPKE